MVAPSLMKLSILLVCTTMATASDELVPPASNCNSDAEPIAKFRSALGEDLTVLVLQYTMHDREAEETLTSNPAHGLAHLYHEHKRGFVQEPGVEVTGAGNTQTNGW